MSHKETSAGIFDQATQEFIGSQTLAAYNAGLEDGEGDLLDQFATAAMQGMLASEAVPDESVIGSSYISYEPEGVARRAYNIAEAMLAERQARRQK